MSRFTKHRTFYPILALGLLSMMSTARADQSHARLRRPCAVAVSGDHAFVANRVSGTVSTIDIRTHSLVAESPVGEQLSDIVVCPDGDHLLAVDEAAGKLVMLSHAQGKIQIVKRADVPPYPVSISISPNGKSCSIASLWTRQLTIINLSSLLDPERPPTKKTIDLKIAPRTQCWLSNDRLVVADSFGGKLTVIDAAHGQQLVRMSLDGHNIRGLSLNAEHSHLFITHQILNSHEPTERQRVFWGDVMGNILRSVALSHIDELCDRAAAESSTASQGNATEPAVAEYNVAHWMFHPLGEPSNAAGDPAEILVNTAGQTVVMLSGTNEVALRSGDHKVFARRAVGKRPIDGTLTENGKTAIIVNHFDDSVSFVSLDEKTVTGTVSLGKQPELTLAQQGEVLFYDAHLSLDKWYSCHSCHTDGHTNGQLNDNFGDDSYGAPKRILSLLGVAHTAPWAWNGSQDSLEDQVAKSIKITMQGQIPDEQRAKSARAITAYLHTLDTVPSVDVLRGHQDTAAIARGKNVFESAGCIECHKPDRYTSDGTFDMGVVDKNATERIGTAHEFNPPSLIGFGQRGALLHDASTTTVEGVFANSNHGKLTVNLGESSVADLTAFLKNL